MSFFKEGRGQEIIKVVKKQLNTRFTKYGLPFLILVVGGSFGLQYFTSIRYEFRKVNKVTREVFKKEGVEMKEPEEVTLEAIYDQVKQLDIDNWTNIRGPRPWEEPQPQQQTNKK